MNQYFVTFTVEGYPDSISSDIKTIKNWFKFWSILSIFGIIISVIIILNH